MDLASRIEHTALKPTVTERELDKLLSEAVEYHFHGICVPPFWVKRMAREAAATGVQLVTVVGFPLGYHQTETKILEAQTALDQGADEIDLVWNISAYKAGMTWPKIEIARASSLVHRYEKLLKVIIETSYLNNDEIREACLICQDAGVDFVKTSTGFAGSGARIEDIRLMRNTLADRVGIKASGGISDRKTAEAMVQAGADRIGTSSGIAIVS
jgi:deoxyribose-phosphate aldolase